MMSCFGYALSKKRNTKVKPFTDIKKIHVYENKHKVRTVIPYEPTKTLDYKKN